MYALIVALLPLTMMTVIAKRDYEPLDLFSMSQRIAWSWRSVAMTTEAKNTRLVQSYVRRNTYVDLYQAQRSCIFRWVRIVSHIILNIDSHARFLWFKAKVGKGLYRLSTRFRTRLLCYNLSPIYHLIIAYHDWEIYREMSRRNSLLKIRVDLSFFNPTYTWREIRYQFWPC